MNSPPRLTGIGRDQLLAMIAKLVEENRELRAELAKLKEATK